MEQQMETTVIAFGFGGQGIPDSNNIHTEMLKEPAGHLQKTQLFKVVSVNGIGLGYSE